MFNKFYHLTFIHFKTFMKEKYFLQSEQGFSLIELLIVVILIFALATFAFLGTSSPKLFAADTQAMAILDVLQEARQKALTQGQTLRVELNDTKKQLRLIDENNTVTSADDNIISTSNFNPETTVGTKPANINAVGGIVPQSTSPIPEIQYVQTTYPLSANDKVKTLRFLKTGEVVDAGTDNLGTGALSSGVTIYVYNGPVGRRSSVVRAITLSGITAVSQLFKCQTNAQGICTAWVK